MGIDVKEKYFEAAGFSGSDAVNTPEKKFRTAPYADPVTLNFKWMINWSKPYGLFSDESNTNSALAYLKRIGETARYEMLKLFISKFTEFIKNYDFLILEVDGLDSIFNRKPYEFPREGEDKLIFTIRETVDLRIQALISLYKEIWFDSVRCVEVLPANIRRFDAYVLVYNSGYYNSLLYDIKPFSTSSYDDINDISKKIFPTLNKLTNLSDNDISKTPFNHTIIYVGDASFATDESGKSFFSGLTNEMSGEYVKNTMGITYNFCKSSGMFSNVSGTIDYGTFLSSLALYSANNNQQTNNNNSTTNSESNFLNKLFEATQSAAGDTWDNIKDTITDLGEKSYGPSTPIGNALDYFSDPNKLVGSISNAINAGIDSLTNTYVDGNIAKVQNFVSRNFSENMLTDFVLNELKPRSGVKFEEIPQIESKTQAGIKYEEKIEPYSESELQKNIKFEENNVYNRKTF